MNLFKGYVPTKNKACLMKFKDSTSNDLLKLNEVQQLNEYAGILDEDTILIDIDDFEQSEILLDIVDNLGLRCRVYQTTRGKHFLFKNKDVKKCGTHVKLALGLEADIKIGSKNSYSVLKYKGKDRPIIYDILDGEEYQEVPKYLTPVKCDVDFVNLREGDGRNQALFNYILTLQAAGFNKEEIRHCLRLINKYVIKDSLSDRELDVIMRDESFVDEEEFQSDEFFGEKGNFLFHRFSNYLMDHACIRNIEDNLHIYKEGVYIEGSKYIEQEMIKNIPTLRAAQRTEVLKYLNLIVPEASACSAYNIAFKNGIYNLTNDELHDFDSDLVITNLINHDYNVDAYSELGDITLDKLACGDKRIRLLLEEVIGYCFFRRNELRKSFILLGDKKNGKSTFLDIITNILGEGNISNLDLKEIGDRFRTAELFGKLANIGDDIDDEYISNVAVFKKVVSGDPITVERKGQDPFRLKSYAKFLFSANNLPRMKDKTGAVMDRLIIVPFRAVFNKTDADFDPYIKYKLQDEEVIEYFIKVGIEGLKRVLENNSFTINEDIEREIGEFNEKNNPIILFLKETNEEDLLFKSTKDCYLKYSLWCVENGYQALSNAEFGKTIKNHYNLDTQPRKIDGVSVRVYVRK